MDKVNNGGPAFPIEWGNRHSEMRGMTLRDYFAAKAMAATICAVGAEFTENPQGAVAKEAYKFADAMLAARGAP